MRLVMFTSDDSGKVIAINPDFVVEVMPGDTNGVAWVALRGRDDVRVRGEFQWVVARLRNEREASPSNEWLDE